MTLCFVLCPFDFGVLTIYFCMLSSLFVYNDANFKRRNSRGRAKMENRREYMYFNSSVVMLVFIYLKSMQPVIHVSQSKSLPEAFGLIMLHAGFSLCK